MISIFSYIPIFLLPSLFSLTMSTISRTSDEKKSLATDQSRDARGVPAHSYSLTETFAADLGLWAREACPGR